MSNVNIGFFAEEIPEKLYFSGKEVKFPEVYFRYAAVKSEFLPEVRRTIEQMESSFEDKIGYLDNFVKYGVAWVKDELDPLLDFTMEQLSLNGCYGISKDDFFQQYVLNKLDDIPAIYDSMEKAFNDIHERQAEKNAERVAERKARVAAGGNELGEMLWNGVKRSWDGAKNMAEAVDVYNDTLQQKIKDEFIYICYTMVDSFADALYDFEKLNLRNPVSTEDYKRTNAMMKNLASNKIPQSKIEEVAFEIFTKHPFMPEIIEWAVGYYGDKEGHYQEIADAFHIDITTKKKDILQEIYSKIDFNTEESLLRGKELLEVKEKEFSIRFDVFHNKIDSALMEFDLKARTVDGIEYETREMAEKARELSKLYNTLDFSSEENTLKSQKIFLDKENEIGLKNSSLEQKISDMLKVEDQNARTCNGIEYATREEAEVAKKQTEKLQELIFACDFYSKEDIQKNIEEIKSLSLTVPVAEKVLEKLQTRLELLAFIPVNQIELLRLLMIPKVKIVVCVAFFIGSAYFGAQENPFFSMVCIAMMVIVIMATRKRVMQFAEKFIQQKKFKAAALCSEITTQTKEEFMGNIFDK